VDGLLDGSGDRSEVASVADFEVAEVPWMLSVRDVIEIYRFFGYIEKGNKSLKRHNMSKPNNEPLAEDILNVWNSGALQNVRRFSSLTPLRRESMHRFGSSASW